MQAVRRLGPTLVSLHVKDAPPKDVFAELARQGRVTIAPIRESLWDSVRPEPVTIDLTDRPFWEVVREACIPAKVRAMPIGDNEGPGKIVLAPDLTDEMKSPAAFSGSFMVLATGVTRRPSGGGAGPGRRRR